MKLTASEVKSLSTVFICDSGFGVSLKNKSNRPRLTKHSFRNQIATSAYPAQNLVEVLSRRLSSEDGGNG
jgi:hypothetical protein